MLPSRRSTSQRTPRDYTPRILRQTLPFSPPCPAVGIAPTSDVPPLPALKFVATSSLRCTIEHVAPCFGVTTPSRKVCQDTFNGFSLRTCLTPSKFSPVSSTTSNPARDKRIYKSTYSHHRNPRAPLPPLAPPAPTQPSQTSATPLAPTCTTTLSISSHLFLGTDTLARSAPYPSSG